jgi:hypothetical protein
LLLAACRAAPAPGAGLPDGDFKLVEVLGAESTSTVFPATDWVAGLNDATMPLRISIAGGKITVHNATGRGSQQAGEWTGDALQFSHAQEEDGTRLDLRFSGSFTAEGALRGTIEQVWELTEEEGKVRLSGEAVFARVSP